ncbi:tetratricopeptide repeat protein, partial [Flavobacteriales bacterium]|nr:tetratricopeptide repeat protein [Flavobacteriales bacterium]
MNRMPHTYLFALCVALAATVPCAQAQTDFEAKKFIIDGIEAYRSGEMNADSLFALGETHSELQPLAAYNRGRSIMEQEGEPLEARKAFQRAAQETSDPSLEADAWHNTGNSLLMEDDLDGAIEAYKSALRANPRHDAARYNLSYA